MTEGGGKASLFNEGVSRAFFSVSFLSFAFRLCPIFLHNFLPTQAPRPPSTHRHLPSKPPTPLPPLSTTLSGEFPFCWTSCLSAPNYHLFSVFFFFFFFFPQPTFFSGSSFSCSSSKTGRHLEPTLMCGVKNVLISCVYYYYVYFELANEWRLLSVTLCGKSQRKGNGAKPLQLLQLIIPKGGGTGTSKDGQSLSDSLPSLTNPPKHTDSRA